MTKATSFSGDRSYIVSCSSKREPATQDWPLADCREFGPKSGLPIYITDGTAEVDIGYAIRASRVERY